MTADELKEAWLNDEHVLYEGAEWKLTAVIYRKGLKRERIVSAELLPLNGANSLTYAAARDIERIKND